MKFKLAIVVSHPIQHFCPWYASIAKNKNIKLKVFFSSKLGAESYMDVNFKQEIKWGNLYLDEFEHEFLNDGQVIQSTAKLDAPELNTKLDLFNPDVVIIYGYWQLLPRRAYRWATDNNKKLIYISDSELHKKRKLFISLLKRKYIKNYLKKIDYFLTVGDSNAAFYHAHGVADTKLVYSPFPIDIKHFSSKKSNLHVIRQAIREKYSIKNDEVILSMVGKHVSWKNPADIIKALQELENSTPAYVLFLLGSGPDTDELRAEAAKLKNNRVIFTGFVSPESLPDYYAATDIYIHPSEFEPHSLAISEAIYMGCPVILSDRCGSYGISDDVQQGVNGFVYECGNIKQLSQLINRLSSDKKLLIEFSAQSSIIGEQKQVGAHFGGINSILNLLTINT